MVNWSRAQFALTALYHFLFVPLTLGLSFIVAIMNTIYVKTGDEMWKKITRFWMTLFAINFAIGVATGIIMEFEFGTNWSNYSWFVGDIFGAPLAVEGILAFFLESTFFAVMFFGWDRVSKKFHLVSTWLVAIGSNLSAYWILVANGWMQFPTGVTFNPETVRNEMTSFLDVALSPVAISKFLHTISSGYVIGALFVCGISAWFLLKKRHVKEAKRSMVVGASFGILVSIFIIVSGDESAYQVAQKQPVKLAAMEGHYHGHEEAGIVALGILNPKKEINNKEESFLFKAEIPYALSFLGYRQLNAYVPGLDDLVYGNEKQNIESAQSKIEKGLLVRGALNDFKLAKESKDEAKKAELTTYIQDNMNYLGYGYLDKPESIVPPIALTFYTFHIMVALGSWFVVLFFVVLYLSMTNDISKFRKVLWVTLFTIPLGYIAAECGWIVAEVGRQPWAIQDLMPVGLAATSIAAGNIKVSFTIFAVMFTTLLIAEIKIMLRQIKIGFNEGAH
ncbi:MAG: cytochrome ubiquinol oxidase subunit I [Campylobacteraceae bacterium]